jgi:CrcB protein
MSALTWVGVAACGAVGAWARFYVAARVAARRPSTFPWGTFTVNLTGGFALGVITGFAVKGAALVIFGGGLLGGYTTFSTWMVEAQRLGEDGDWRMWLYLAASMLVGAAATLAGWMLAEAIR